MKLSANQNLILIEGAATYERILAEVKEVEINEGLRHIRDFLKIYPDFAPAHNDLAVMYYQTENSLKALAHYEKAHKLDPANVTYRKNLADFYYVELEWTGDAINTYLDILKDNPFDIEALNALGTISLQIGRKEQSRQFFTRTLQLDATNHEALAALQLLPAPLAAPETLRSIPLTPPPTPTPAVQPPEQPMSAPAAQSFQNLFRTAQPEPAKSSDDLYREAITFANADKIGEAIRLLEQIVTQDSQNALAHNDLGVLLQKSGDPRKSRLHHEEAVRLQPANKIFLKNLADLLFIEFDECEEALNIYVRLLAKAPRDIEILKAVAHVCMELGKPDDTKFFLERVLGFQPWDKDALKLLQLLEEVGSTQENK
jgi:Flp pilus assembly protein TadD